MEKKNRELRILIDGYKAQRETNANPLTMALNGTIDAVVQGGIKKYEEAFFCKEYGEKNPADAENIMYLKRIIIDQVRKLVFKCFKHFSTIHLVCVITCICICDS